MVGTNNGGRSILLCTAQGCSDLLIRAHQRHTYDDVGIVMSKWDDTVKANAEDLKRVGVLSSEGDFYNMQRMNSLLGGAIWQMHTRLLEMQERLALIEGPR